MQFFRHKKGGFTLIEMLTVMAIMAILATIVFLAGHAVITYKDKKNTEHRMGKIKMALQAYRDVHDTFYPKNLQSELTRLKYSGRGKIELPIEANILFGMIDGHADFIPDEIDSDSQGNKVIIDAWGTPIACFFVVDIPSSQSSTNTALQTTGKPRVSIKLLSYGPDMKEGTGDDMPLELEKK